MSKTVSQGRPGAVGMIATGVLLAAVAIVLITRPMKPPVSNKPASGACLNRDFKDGTFVMTLVSVYGGLAALVAGITAFNKNR